MFAYLLDGALVRAYVNTGISVEGLSAFVEFANASHGVFNVQEWPLVVAGCALVNGFRGSKEADDDAIVAELFYGARYGNHSASARDDTIVSRVTSFDEFHFEIPKVGFAGFFEYLSNWPALSALDFLI